MRRPPPQDLSIKSLEVDVSEFAIEPEIEAEASMDAFDFGDDPTDVSPLPSAEPTQLLESYDQAVAGAVANRMLEMAEELTRVKRTLTEVCVEREKLLEKLAIAEEDLRNLRNLLNL